MLHFAPLMLCCLFAGSMEKDLARTINERNHTPCALYASFCFAVHVFMLCFPLCYFSRKYGKSFGKYHKVGETPPFPSLVHEHMEKPAPPPRMSCVMWAIIYLMSLWLP